MARPPRERRRRSDRRAARRGAPRTARRPTLSPLPVSSFARDVREAVAALDTVEPGDRLVVFVGKLIASKGVELLLAAFPLVLAREPRARLVIVGFGAFRDGLERLAAQLAAGDLDAAAADPRRGRPRAPAAAPRSSRTRPTRYREAAAGLRDRVAFAGRLDHAELADLLPAAEAMAVTSTFPEAFGMVAAEAAACGTLPVVANHSGLGEVARTLAEAVPPRRTTGSPSRSGRTRCRSSPTRSRAGSRRPTTCAPRTREAIVEATRARYSWDGVARTVIAAAQGDLDDLPDASATSRAPRLSSRHGARECRRGRRGAIAADRGRARSRPRSRSARFDATPRRSQGGDRVERRTRSVSRPVEMTAVATPR